MERSKRRSQRLHQQKELNEMAFFKHVGKANGKKVILIQRQIPGEEHMAAVIYSDIMPTKYHDDVMKLLESDEGQAAFEFKDILQRRMSNDGQNLLQVLSSENLIKRVAANAIMVTPNSKSSMRLDELNELLNKVGRGEAAVQQLEEMEAGQGFTDDPEMMQGSRKKAAAEAKKAAAATRSTDLGESYQPVEQPAAAQPDPMALMMQMMQTMQAMQAEIKSLKGDTAKPKAPKATKTKPAA
jgi:hypothetical protein